MLTIESKGDFERTLKWLDKLEHKEYLKVLEDAGRRGVVALASATPTRTGKTAASWGYEIEKSGSGASITWTNSNINQGVPIAIILQYGHGTGTGGYVAGRDYINPAIRPIMDQIAKDVKEALQP